MDQTAAASSPAEVDVFSGQQPTFDEYNAYRQSGEVPARFKAAPAESAPADTPEKTDAEGEQPESAGDSETPKDQQEKAGKKHLTAEQRKAQLKAKVEELWEADEPDHIRIAQLEATIDRIDAGVRRKTEPAPVTQQAQAPQPNAKPTMDDKKQDGSPRFNDWDEYNEALTDWKVEQKLAERDRQHAHYAQQREIQAKVDSFRQQYGEDYESVIDPTAGAIGRDQDIPLEVKWMISQSDVVADLLLAIGSDSRELAKLIQTAKTDKFSALRHIATLEANIRADKGSSTTATGRNSKGQFTSKEANEQPTAPPAKQQTQAPKPPSPVGGSSSRAFDVSDDSVSSEEWARKRNEQQFGKR